MLGIDLGGAFAGLGLIGPLGGPLGLIAGLVAGAAITHGGRFYRS